MNDHEPRAGTAPLNPETLRSLFGDDEETIHEILVTFADDLVNSTRTLDEALAARDRKAFGRAAHSMKGASANVGAEAFAELCASVERRCPDAPWEDLDALARSVRVAAEALGAHVRAVIAAR